jgi:hypothetical protein
MSDVTFQEDTLAAPVQNHAEKKSLLVRMVLKTGVAKDDKEAQKVLLGVALTCVALSILSLFLGGVL